MSTFTPGPWAIRRGHSTVEIMTVAGLRLAQTTTDPYWQAFSAESEANARLIAAAPDLLAALETARVVVAFEADARGDVDGDYDQPASRALEEIDAAIAKATGETQTP